MKENTSIKSRIPSPLQLAEEANRGFVKVVQQIVRIINYDFHTTRPDASDSCLHNTMSVSRARYQPVSPRRDIRTSDFSSFSSSVSADSRETRSAEEVDPTEMITLLFSDLAEQRLTAIRWIFDHRYADALPILESILLIEDNHQVYEEVCNLINVLREIDVE